MKLKSNFIASCTFFALFLSMAGWLQAQNAGDKPPVPRFTAYPVAWSGASAYFPADPGEFTVTASADSSDVYTAEVAFGSYNWGAIVVKFHENLTDLTETEKAELLESYLNFLKGEYSVVSSAGYGRGHTMESNPAAQGVIDFWEDDEGTQYQIKGWVDTDFLAVMMVYGEEDYPYYNALQMFLNGFRFPGHK